MKKILIILFFIQLPFTISADNVDNNTTEIVNLMINNIKQMVTLDNNQDTLLRSAINAYVLSQQNINQSYNKLLISDHEMITIKEEVFKIYQMQLQEILSEEQCAVLIQKQQEKRNSKITIDK